MRRHDKSLWITILWDKEEHIHDMVKLEDVPVKAVMDPIRGL